MEFKLPRTICVCGAEICQLRQKKHDQSTRHQNFLRTGCQTNYHLYDFVNQKAFAIKWQQNGKLMQKKFRYTRTNKDEVKINAENYLNELMNQ